MRLCALVWLAALMASAQSYEIRGVLLEKATERSVKGLLTFKNESGNPTGSVETNLSGEFHIRREPGLHEIDFEGNDQYRRARVLVELMETDRSKSVRVLVERVGRVAGRVIDDATGEPVKDAPVQIMQVHWILGQLEAEEEPVNTDADGRFHGSGGHGYPWVIGIKPKMMAPTNDAEHVIRSFTKTDLEATDEDYEESYWPGGVRVMGESLPAPYIPDQTVDVGNIRARKMKYRRALVRFPMQEGCFEGQEFRARFVKPRDETRDFTVRCGQDQLLKGLISGIQYRIEVAPDDQLKPELWRTAALDFVIGEKNPEVRVLLARGVDLQVRVKFADGSSAAKTPLSLTLKAGDLWQERRLDKEGRFQFESVPLGEQEFDLNSDDGHYAQHVKMNGVEAEGRDHKFEWTGRGTLDVVVDDQPGAVGGMVTDGSRGVGLAAVYVVPWPIPVGKNVFDVRYSVMAHASGQYQVDGLPPGRYRVVAGPWDENEKLYEPGVLERLLASAETVTVGRGSSVTLDVRVVELK